MLHFLHKKIRGGNGIFRRPNQDGQAMIEISTWLFDLQPIFSSVKYINIYADNEETLDNNKILKNFANTLGMLHLERTPKKRLFVKTTPTKEQFVCLTPMVKGTR